MIKSQQTAKPQNQYTNMYLFLLIVSTCFAILTAPSFLDIPHLLEYYSQHTPVAALLLIDYSALAVGGVGLILLFQKRRIGLYLTLFSLGVQFIIACISLFFIEPIVAYYATTIDPQEFPTHEDKEIFLLFMRTVFYLGIPIGLAINAALVVFWQLAWNGQVKVIKTHKPPKN